MQERVGRPAALSDDEYQGMMHEFSLASKWMREQLALRRTNPSREAPPGISSSPNSLRSVIEVVSPFDTTK